MEKEQDQYGESSNILETLVWIQNLKLMISQVEKTIFAYQTYKSTQESANSINGMRMENAMLQTLEAVALTMITDGQCQIQKTGRGSSVRYSTNPSDCSNIQITDYVIDSRLKQKGPEFQYQNVKVFEGQCQGEKVRIVTIPFDENQCSNEKISEMLKFIQNLANQHFMAERKPKETQLEELKAKNKRQLEIEEQKMVEKEKVLQMKMFKLEILIKNFVSKSNKIGLCAIGALEDQLDKASIKLKTEAYTRLFNFDQKLNQQIFLLNDSGQKFDEPQCTSGKFVDSKSIKNQYFEEHDNNFINSYEGSLRTNFYRIRAGEKNRFLPKAIKQFVDQVQRITTQAVTCPVSFLYDVYCKESFYPINTEVLIPNEPILPDLDVSGISMASRVSDIELEDTMKFSELFHQYNHFKKFNLETREELKEYFDQEVMRDIIIENQEEKIPTNIKGIQFIHQFCSLTSAFLAEYERKSKIMGQNKNQMLLDVYNLVKKFCELIQQIRVGYQDESYSIQTYFNFISFLFESINIISYVTGRSFSIVSNLKEFLEKVNPKKAKIICQLIESDRNANSMEESLSLSFNDSYRINKFIIKDQPSHYYDLLLRILTSNASSGAETQRESIFFIDLLINYMKACYIFDFNIENKDKCVQAVKSLTKIIEFRSRIPETRKNQLNIYEIQNKIATILSNIPLFELALIFYKKNQNINKVKECFKENQHYLQSNEARYANFMQNGKYLLEISDFNDACNYFNKAYQVASSDSERRLAIAGRLNCIRQINPNKEALELRYQRFARDGPLEEFVGAPISNEVFLRIKNIVWDHNLKRYVSTI